MAGRYLVTVLRRGKPTAGVRFYSDDEPPLRYKIGKREIVGYGLNGTESYLDLEECPMPAIRYKEVTPEIQILREREKGDWKKLTIQEKKDLYRASFCQTFVEMDAPTGEWKLILAGVCTGVGIALLLFTCIKKFVYSPLPVTFDQEHQTAQYERMRQLDMNPIHGMNRRR
ncbi:cytochrome c oxidase subunit 4 isoform 1, mitochondrial [Diachasma alloeum]|uniref:Cytochrome c oxidase subunit 4 n=1 Tax=Diachasma alloeum TaxID=454923 RepID=A0A4E0RTA5_9HYME|nr:cytochrome c oxidase subunit 4 isoform 1, mitochondrial [Diachasma alloeum]THK33207.1 subunit IV, cytochrome c oxidase [Diachasma alloeum]